MLMQYKLVSGCASRNRLALIYLISCSLSIYSLRIYHDPIDSATRDFALQETLMTSKMPMQYKLVSECASRTRLVFFWLYPAL